MFELRIMVEDKKLPEVMWALDGKIAEPPVILPVREATVKKGKVVSTNPAGTTKYDVIRTYLIDKWGSPTITTPEIREAMAAYGITVASQGSYTQRLRKEGILTNPKRLVGKGLGKGGKSASYTIVKPKQTNGVM